jgi:hypothetical protein
MSISPSVTVWNRLEPRPRARDLTASLLAEVRDPLWFLSRQWQVGEFQGEDAGSPAFAQHSVTVASMANWAPAAGGAPAALDPGVPLERQALAEAFAPSLTVRVELGQTFEQLLAKRLSDAAAVTRIIGALRGQPGFLISAPTVQDPFNPIDPATSRFLLVCGGRALDGSALLALAASVAGGDGLPPGVTNGDAETQAVEGALAGLSSWVQAAYGQLAEVDPAAWRADLIEYGVTVNTATPDNGHAALSATPDERGEFQWSSFDVVGADATPVQAPTTTTRTIIPAHVRFRGMPAPRFWDFETNEVSFADIQPNKQDLVKALVTDFMLVHGVDWFLFGIDQPTGTISRVDYIVVTDVFGGRTLIDRADKSIRAPGPTRWTMYSNTQVAAGSSPAGISDYFVVPPSAGPSMVTGPALEEVRFARDETANMAFGIERLTMSPVGTGRRGAERDAAVDAANPAANAPSQDQTSPLRYLTESKVPVQYIPLVPVPLAPNDPSNPAIILEKAGILRPKADGTYDVVQATGRILNPQSIPASSPYQIREEQIPRAGVSLQRNVYRSRWRDGTTHLWIARRRQTGGGEAQAGLRFDAALPTNT